jgi:hypothetical protein
LLPVDVNKFGRFEMPGHKVTGDRTQRSRRVGWDYAHTLLDDCSRLAYTELLDDERADTVTAFMTRALDWFLDHGTGRRPTARSSATSRPSLANGPTARSTPAQTPAAKHCHTG